MRPRIPEIKHNREATVIVIGLDGGETFLTALPSIVLELKTFMKYSWLYLVKDVTSLSFINFTNVSPLYR